ncbi:MAG TPA: DMT family transporter [Terriglobia bacterium]|jgi:bacterial/archaeal transporter family protein|nr:DMT family transporter [Terriglobia bacterium]
MLDWLSYSLLAMVLWGIVGLLQKMGANRISAHSLLVWLTVGFLVLMPWFLQSSSPFTLGIPQVILGIVAGTINGMGSWFLFASLGLGAKASVAIPLTALYPLLTILLAVVFLAENLTSLQWIGILLALVGGVMLSYETGETAAFKD